MSKLHTSISDFMEGGFIYGFYHCQGKDMKYSKHGDKYLDIILTDKKSTVYGKIWSHVDFFDLKFESDMVVAVKGKVVKYRNNLELNILNINSLNVDLYTKYGFKKSLIN